MAFHFIGDGDTALGFQFAGVTCSAVSTVDEAERAFDEVLQRRNASILIVTELVASQLEERVTAHRLTAAPPFIVEVPDVWGTSVERKSMAAMIQEAVGVRISGTK